MRNCQRIFEITAANLKWNPADAKLPKQMRRFVLFALLILVPLCSVAQQSYRFRDHYTKIEYRIPMRDGVKLYTAVYVPKSVPGSHPILMERTPYGAGPVGPDRYNSPRGSQKLKDAGYIFAFQDVRGQGASEGEFENVRPQLKPGQKGIDESTDTWDTVEFLIKNVPDNNGSVGLWGISYPGFYAGAGGINTHPSLKAISPQAPVSDWFLGDDMHHNGVFFQQDSFDFFQFFGAPRAKPGEPEPPRIRVDREGKNAYDFFLSVGPIAEFNNKYLKNLIPFWNEVMAHPNYDDFWKDRSLPRNMKGVKCAVLTVGGWFDAEDLWGALNLYAFTEKQNPGIENFLVMGPWSHGLWASPSATSFASLQFEQNTSKYFQDEVEFPFFEKYLRNVDTASPSEATMYLTGANKWMKFENWPPKNLKRAEYYLDVDKILVTTPPHAASRVTYTYDPAKPTPYTPDWETSNRRPSRYVAEDQRYFESRYDVSTYSTAAIPESVVVAGPIECDVWISTTGTDADLVVKVIDVWPDDLEGEIGGKKKAGYQQMVRGDIMRCKFRNSFERPSPLRPNQPERIRFKLNDVLHSFEKGHRIMVQIQSAWFPLADRNPNAFLDITKAQAADFVPAQISILAGDKHASKISFGTIAQ